MNHFRRINEYSQVFFLAITTINTLLQLFLLMIDKLINLVNIFFDIRK